MNRVTLEQRVTADTRSRVYWLLARLFGTRPEPELLERLAATPPSRAADADGVVSALVHLHDTLAREAPQALAERLAPEHTRLFGGLRRGYGPPPPFESVYRRSPNPAEVALEVMAAYEAAGFGAMDEALGPPDTVSAELEFMALACFRESEAWAQGDAQEALAWQERQRTFLDEHLLAWLPALCDALRAATREPYFRHVADLAEATCRADRDDLSPPASSPSSPTATTMPSTGNTRSCSSCRSAAT
ncbi:MAG: hypothetical protein A3E31_17215 [Candidatus Rokubacteria bacterium RIFCSPHIGHO2_12_FULL_73_22]|nr:MAG: hypothetical protein A3D33_09605 [Candidatus Rokubacteria bacterium RIFCSPHIGHO2_02_FULL_73_26]OGL02239.1 MAG: hypothetical protein A3E31_17215 [Candidatus Rokubacteria bacterium RIFCSPHIGHO2_12_FULL_73_22]OGL10123.1 MAG: hypothetical protein A3I14_13175 [Candidatus Rokubacteria bacterium RIFCSPLOWO2_02_FULL_73_56]OGL28075.1 MAG: hypothetical protein A3G44_11195 [Candidatus Rokubacteria bacterium RIFCSPLOWO2_12_FULL_73_47]